MLGSNGERASYALGMTSYAIREGRGDRAAHHEIDIDVDINM